LEAQLSDDGYEEEQGEPAKTGTLAHEAAKLWYRPGGTFTDPNECFRAAMDGCAHKELFRGGEKVILNELPHEASSIQEARTMFDMIIAHYKREVLKVIFAERRYKGPLKNGVPVHMILDMGVDRGNGLLELIDYKTGFLSCTTDEMWDKDQVLMNLLAARMDPEFAAFTTIQYTYFWIRKGYETGPISLSDERLKDYEHFLALEYQRLLEVTEPIETLNRFCKSCGRRDKCLKYREWMTEAMGETVLFTPEQLAALDDDAVMGRFEKLKGQIKALDELKDQLGEHLKGVLAQRQLVEVTGKTFKAVMRTSKHDSYSVSTVVALCQAMGKDPSSVFSIKGKEVEQLFSDNPQALSQLNLTKKRGQTAPSLQVVQVGVKRKSSPRKPKADASEQPASTTIQGANGAPAIPTEDTPL
jgi:hypothetical protein